ncbi:GIY-YIG nuclease family protein [Fulvivirga lutimaris]|uniref:GIY-YIG nuclease family protein n=1 Tax=Fulvivirga lutimaris TaxID=1819566 RepID=UPI0012BB839E|nr:GIY-YIG nuclease family protein [Fulvivirga lutimaris]MTI41137.1 GIY-YIG nuclease family protein [Fulvivirga lutimaris]
MFYVYMLTNKNHSVLYTGFTDNLDRRVFEHKNQLVSGFTSKYNCNKLVYFEEFIEKDEALHRERQLKRYKRSWKENLINEKNPEWEDLYGNY